MSSFSKTMNYSSASAKKNTSSASSSDDWTALGKRRTANVMESKAFGSRAAAPTTPTTVASNGYVKLGLKKKGEAAAEKSGAASTAEAVQPVQPPVPTQVAMASTADPQPPSDPTPPRPVGGVRPLGLVGPAEFNGYSTTGEVPGNFTATEVFLSGLHDVSAEQVKEYFERMGYEIQKMGENRKSGYAFINFATPRMAWQSQRTDLCWIDGREIQLPNDDGTGIRVWENPREATGAAYRNNGGEDFVDAQWIGHCKIQRLGSLYFFEDDKIRDEEAKPNPANQKRCRNYDREMMRIKQVKLSNIGRPQKVPRCITGQPGIIDPEVANNVRNVHYVFFVIGTRRLYNAGGLREHLARSCGATANRIVMLDSCRRGHNGKPVCGALVFFANPAHALLVARTDLVGGEIMTKSSYGTATLPWRYPNEDQAWTEVPETHALESMNPVRSRVSVPWDPETGDDIFDIPLNSGAFVREHSDELDRLFAEFPESISARDLAAISRVARTTRAKNLHFVKHIGRSLVATLGMEAFLVDGDAEQLVFETELIFASKWILTDKNANRDENEEKKAATVPAPLPAEILGQPLIRAPPGLESCFAPAGASQPSYINRELSTRSEPLAVSHGNMRPAPALELEAGLFTTDASAQLREALTDALASRMATSRASTSSSASVLCLEGLI